MLSFLGIGITYETFHCFGTEDVEQLKISYIGKFIKQIVRLIKNEGVLSGVLVILSLKWLIELTILSLLIK